MKQDRFLLGILIGIGVVIVVALVLFFSRQQTQSYRTNDSPGAVVYNYTLALSNEDYQKAYGYLANLPNKPTYEAFRRSFLNDKGSSSNVGVDVGVEHFSGTEATVEINLVHPSSDPFSSGYISSERALLVKQNGEWRLSSMPYELWDFGWYRK